ncbi:hypothetical protein D7Y41_29010, partial [Anaerotruncus sp. 1XD22-93]
SSPNFRGASALLRGSSRAFSPKRASRDAPSVCLAGEGSVTPPRRPHPDKLGATSFFLNLKFYSIFFKKLRFPKAGPLVAHRTASRSEAFRSATAEGGSWRGDRAKYFIL